MIIWTKKSQIRFANALVIIAITAVWIFTGGTSFAAGKGKQQLFTSPEKAIDQLMEAVQRDDVKQLTALFGPGGIEIFPSTPQDNDGSREKFLKAYREKHRLEKIGMDRVVLHVGHEDWPWPVPIVKTGRHWHFDTQAGIREITARRIGRNEVAAVQVCLAYVDAQLEYAKQHIVGGIDQYAQKLASDPGQDNGLCWNAKDGEKPSLLGPRIAYACEEETARPVSERLPYHGYYYRILKSQGPDAPGGPYDYVVDKKMIAGFALVAYPAIYGATGIMTFIVNKDGIVYQKDLGKNSRKIAMSMTAYNPDATWKKVD